MRHPPLQAPLLWQTYLGFWIAGITAAPWPLPSLCCALLLFFADARLWRAARTALAALCLLAGFLTGYWQLYGCPCQRCSQQKSRQGKRASRRECAALYAICRASPTTACACC